MDNNGETHTLDKGRHETSNGRHQFQRNERQRSCKGVQRPIQGPAMDASLSEGGIVERWLMVDLKATTPKK